MKTLMHQRKEKIQNRRNKGEKKDRNKFKRINPVIQ